MSKKSMGALLSPSLKENTMVGQPYSSTAHFLISWFGGAIAASLLCLLSAKKMGILKANLLVIIGFILLSIAGTVLLVMLRLDIISVQFFSNSDELRSASKIINQLFGVTIYGLFYLFFQRYLKAARLSPGEAPSPWAPAAACIALGYAFVSLFGFFISSLIKT